MLVLIDLSNQRSFRLFALNKKDLLQILDALDIKTDFICSSSNKFFKRITSRRRKDGEASSFINNRTRSGSAFMYKDEDKMFVVKQEYFYHFLKNEENFEEDYENFLNRFRIISIDSREFLDTVILENSSMKIIHPNNIKQIKNKLCLVN